MTSISGVAFSAAWAERVEVAFGPVRVHVVGRAAFVTHKLASGRPKDRLDLELLAEGDSG